MICKANNLEEGTLEVMLPAGSDKIFENVRRVSVKTCDRNLAKFFPEKAFGAEAWIRVEDEYNTIDREKAIANIKAAYCCGCENYNGVRCRACQIMDVMDVLEDEPAVVPDVQRWRKTAEVQARTVYRFARSSDGAGTNLLYGENCKPELVCKLAVVVCESGS